MLIQYKNAFTSFEIYPCLHQQWQRELPFTKHVHTGKGYGVGPLTSDVAKAQLLLVTLEHGNLGFNILPEKIGLQW